VPRLRVVSPGPPPLGISEDADVALPDIQQIHQTGSQLVDLLGIVGDVRIESPSAGSRGVRSDNEASNESAGLDELLTQLVDAWIPDGVGSLRCFPLGDPVEHILSEGHVRVPTLPVVPGHKHGKVGLLPVM